MKQLSESVQQEIPDESGELDLENMLGGLMDTNIGKIAKEVAGTMDMEQVFGNVDESTNPMELMSQMMNPDKMGKIFQNINSVMEKKMEILIAVHLLMSLMMITMMPPLMVTKLI